MSMFQKAVKGTAKLRMAIIGTSGSGKTWTALAVASGLADGGGIALVDTEHGSASKYADSFDFDVAEMSAPYHPDKYIRAIEEAEKAGYSVVILDSLTHAWSGDGGILAMKDEFAKRREYNDYTAWKPAGDIYNNLVNAIVGANIHVITTMRAKMKYAMEEYTDSSGRVKQKPVKIGMGAIQKDEMEYEHDIVFEMDQDNNAIVTKSRCPRLSGKVIARPGAEVAAVLREWLHGAPVEKRQAAEPEKQPEATQPTQATTQHRNGAQPQMPDVTQWATKEDGYRWAVDIGACAAIPHAKNAMYKIIKEQFGGQVGENDKQRVFELFAHDRLEKLAHDAQQAQAA